MAKQKAEKKTATTSKKAVKKVVKKSSTTKKSKAKTADDGPQVKKKVKRKKKVPVEIRMKVFWGVFNHAMKRVALYEFNQRKAAEKRAQELTESGKPPHFVMKVKEQVGNAN